MTFDQAICCAAAIVSSIYKRKNRRASLSWRALVFLVRLREAKVVDGDPCGMYNYFIRNTGTIRSWIMNLLNLLAPIGWGPPVSRTPAYQHSASGVGVSTPCWAVSTRGITAFVLVCRSCRGMEGYLSRGCNLFLPGWRWFYKPQPISDQPEGLGFPHRA